MKSKGSYTFTASNQLLRRAERVIPLGSQTFSKCHTQYPRGFAPLFLTHGRGGRVWDADGNIFIDLVCGLMPVLLGYRDVDVDRAIAEQLEKGIIFSLATELEIELAERLVEIVPCAEAVRFGKNGSDATSAAVRVARAFTGRDRIAAGGYHGWHDWYIGSTVRDKGVPGAVGELTHRFPYGDLEALDAILGSRPGEFAAVILEPADDSGAAKGFLEEARFLAHEHGALLIFDEVITGFRYSLGGAQELFSVTPDLATFGKGMANGMPLSAVVGRAELMREMEDIFFSMTFGGETLSLAAGIAVIDKLKREPVIESIWKTGSAIVDGARRIAEAKGVSDLIRFDGLPPCHGVSFRDHENADSNAITTFFMREMLSGGVLINGSHNICYAHNDTDVEAVLNAYEQTLELLADALKSRDFIERLGCKVIKPVFSIR